MNEPSLDEQLAGARAYESLHVPALFAQWAPRVLDAVGIGAGHRVLDVACGTGILAREAAVRVGAKGSVSGIDLDAGMLAVAKELSPSLDWREGAAEELPYPDGSFDVVVSQFGLMFFRDRPRAAQEMLRVLRPGGRMAVAVWDSLDNSEAYPIVVDLLDRLGGVDAANALRAPFVLGDKEELLRLFADSGTQSIRIASERGIARFPNIKTMVEADLRGWLPVMGVFLSEEQIESILEAAEGALAQYVQKDGRVEFESPAHIVTGEAPAD